jgi:hypothetical protein
MKRPSIALAPATAGTFVLEQTQGGGKTASHAAA